LAIANRAKKINGNPLKRPITSKVRNSEADMEKRLNELDEAITNTPSYLSKQRSQLNFRIQEKSKQSEQSSKG
jgi:paraquat-inducible protein B